MEKFNTCYNIFFKIVKLLALFIPSALSVSMLVILVMRIGELTTDVDLLEAKMNAMIGIIGVAVTVWVGLNIYNVVTKDEIEEAVKQYGVAKEMVEKQKNEIEGMVEKQKNELQILRDEIKRLYVVDSELRILAEAAEIIGIDKVNAEIKRCIESYCSLHENLIISSDYRCADIEETKYLIWQLRSNKNLTEERRVYEIRELIEKEYPSLKIKVIPW